VLWTYESTLPPRSLTAICCDVENRGLAIYGNRVDLETLDDHLLAFDARTEHIDWDKVVAPSGTGYSMTAAPLIVDGKVIVGVSGGEYGIRGFIAPSTDTGDVKWTHYNVESKRGGGGGMADGFLRPGDADALLRNGQSRPLARRRAPRLEPLYRFVVGAGS